MDEMQLNELQNIPDFINPDGWPLQFCMKSLIEDENCDPNIEDNYGETLINMAISHFKTLSIDTIIQSGNLKINEANAKGVTPIGQAIMSRNY